MNRHIQLTDRRYPPLRSAPSTTNGEPIPPQAPLVKRRRLGVSVACNVCRRRKIRCDGRRPRCINCVDSGTECTYRDEAEFSPEAAKLVVEVVQILNSLPTEEAIWTLQLLSGEANAPTIMSMLRGEVSSSKQKLADDGLDAAASPAGRPQTPLEFQVQNPVAYPAVTLVSSDALNTQPRAGKLPSNAANGINGQDPASAYLPDPTPAAQANGDVHDISRLSRTQSASASQTDESSPAPPRSELCDARLREVDVQFWTDVQIDQDVAIKCVSLYFETDHPVLANFDADLFITGLVEKREEHCSRLLVNALLYWAYQMYSSITPETYTLALDFCAEAEELWRVERSSGRDTLTTLAAAEFLCLGYLGQGRDHAILAYMSEASRMGQRMGLFGVEPEEEDTTSGSEYATDSADDATRARHFAAWGVFNWITLMSLFYRQPGMDCPKHPPRVSIPEPSNMPSSKYMGATFPQICRFWAILHEVTMVYGEDGREAWGSGATLSFAEFKFRELLAWSNTLPSRLTRDIDHSHHVQILHIWFHAAILDIFRPFVKAEERECQMRTFAGNGTTINAVCAASVAQLKHLIVDYRLNDRPSYSILWHTAIVYVVNAILDGETEPNWYPDLLLCIYAYEALNRSWRVAASIAKSLLSLAMNKGKLSSRAARRIIREIEDDGAREISDEVRATFMADLDLALSDPGSATVEHLANQFETNMLFQDLTFDWEDNKKEKDSLGS